MDSKNNKKPMTEAQKKARLINLQRGREVRKQKQESKGKEYDLSSESSQSDSESDNEAFVISRKKKIVPKDVVERSRKSVHMEQPQNTNNYQKDFDELRNMVQELAVLQKKNKAKSSKRSNGGTKIVVLPQNNSHASKNNSQSSKNDDGTMDFLRKSLGL